MTTTFATTINQHIESLETAFDESTTTVDWLVIAHNDSVMLRGLCSAMSDESAAVLELSQDTWDFDGGELSEAIEWAIQQGRIKKLLIVGHSQAIGTSSHVSLVSSNAKQESPSSYDKLVAGVGRTNAVNQAARSHFASQVQQMLQVPVVHSHCAGGDLAVHGLFYYAESGLFLAYDAKADRYRPLMS